MLLEGLDVCEISLSELLFHNDVFRVDAEYFGKAALRVINRLHAISAVPLASLATITDGIHTSLPFVEDGEVKVLSAKHPKENYIDRSGFETVTAKFHSLNPRTALRENDVLISTVGTIGNSAVVTSDLLPANSDRHIGIVRLNGADMSPYFLSTFLLGCYGRTQSNRETTGNVQPNLFISKIGQILVPRFSSAFETKITKLVEIAYRQRESAAGHLLSGETKLLHALGLDNWQAPEPLSYVRSSRDAFAAGRFDAEYFYPAKTAALATLTQLSDSTIGDLFESVRNLWQPADGQPAELVRNYDLTDALSPFLDGGKEAVARESIASTKKTIVAGDLVVSRLRSYLKEIAIVQPGGETPMVASTEFIVLRPKTSLVPVEALLIYLRSTLPQLVFKWSQDGSNHPRFDEQELLRLPIPKALIAHANDYIVAVQSMISARQRATQLLEAAKRAVEIAIENSESAALAYLAEVDQ